MKNLGVGLELALGLRGFVLKFLFFRGLIFRGVSDG